MMSVSWYLELRSVLMWVTVALALSLAACGGSGGSTNTSSSSSAPVVAPSGLSYPSPQNYAVGTAITALNPAITGIPASYSVSPALPAGLVLNTVNGQITGAPTAITPAATYTITATNSVGSTTFALAIVVNSTLPPVVTVSYGVKQVILNWGAVAGATYYQVFKNSNGMAGYTQLGANLAATTFTDILPVHLTDWLNTSYIVTACNNQGCVNSATVNALDARQAVGYFKASNAGASDRFGSAVALSADGNTLAVGAPFEGSNAMGINGPQTDNSKSIAGAVYVFTRSGNTWSQQAYVKASNTDAGDRFGIAVALSADGSTLVLGATGEDSNATGINGAQADNSMADAGAVYVFTRSGNAWSQQAYVKASNTDGGDLFGRVVALSTDGDVLAVGAEFEGSLATGVNGTQSDNSMVGAGAVYVFARSGNIWSQQAYMKASNTESGDGFGGSVALSADGNTVAVGASREDSNATGINGVQSDNSKSAAGAGYVFTRSGNTWSQQAYVKASNTDASDLFGRAVALSADGDVLVVGAIFEDSLATDINGTQTDATEADAGAVYVYIRSGSTWSQQAYVKASNTRYGGAQFGGSVALSADGSVMAVGAMAETSNATGINGNQLNTSTLGAGAVYVFTRSGNTWSKQAYVKASNTEAQTTGSFPFGPTYDYFGSTAALSADGNTLAVGSFEEDSNATGINGVQTDNSAQSAGAVYVY